MSPLRAVRRHRARYALAVLALIGAALVVTQLISSANEVDRIRGDFCSWAQVHARQARLLPQSPARAADAASDVQLVRRLGCPA